MRKKSKKEVKIYPARIDAIREIASKYTTASDFIANEDIDAMKRRLNLNSNEFKYLANILNGIYAGLKSDEIASVVCDSALAFEEPEVIVTFGKEDTDQSCVDAATTELFKNIVNIPVDKILSMLNVFSKTFNMTGPLVDKLTAAVETVWPMLSNNDYTVVREYLDSTFSTNELDELEELIANIDRDELIKFVKGIIDEDGTLDAVFTKFIGIISKEETSADSSTPESEELDIVYSDLYINKKYDSVDVGESKFPEVDRCLAFLSAEKDYIEKCNTAGREYIPVV